MKTKQSLIGVMVICFAATVFAVNGFGAVSGDVDGSGKIDLKDVITAIQICAGISPTSAVHGENDADSDGKIGLADAVFASQVVSGKIVLPYNPGDMGVPADYETTLISMSAAFPDMIAQLPESFDWRDNDVVTRAKDERPVTPADHQGRCGSCWAFAAAGAMESKILMLGGPEYDLSEQQQVSCNAEQYGCCGGFLNASLLWRDRGPLRESCTDYGDYGTQPCDCNPICNTSALSKLSCDSMATCPQLSYRTDKYYSVNAAYSNEVKISLRQDGPAPFRFTVYKDFFDFWNKVSFGSVYRNSGANSDGSGPSGHAVLLIGWDDGKQAWLCKNSWGETAGPNGDGTFWIAYSGHANNLHFGMANFTIKDTASPTTTSSTTSTTVSPTTTTTTVKPSTTTTSISTTSTTTTSTTVKPTTTTTTVSYPIIASVDTPGSASDIAVSGTNIYVADGESGLLIISVSNPTNPQIIASVDTPGSAFGIAVSGTNIYVADGESGLQIISVSNPTNPQIIAWVDTPGQASDVSVSDTTVYVADGERGLQIISVSDPTNPKIIASVDTPGSASGIAVSGTTAYVADQNSGLQIISVSNPANP